MAAQAKNDSDHQLSGNVKALVGNIAAREGFTSYRLQATLASGKGDNYIGVVYRVRIVGRRDDQDGQSTSLILKCTPEGRSRRGSVDVDTFFENEVAMYREVVAAFQELQTMKGVPAEERFDSVPKLLGCDASPEAGITLALEDMATSGYVMGDRKECLDAAHCSLVLRELAKLHAFSYALRDQQPLRFRQLRSLVKEALFLPRPSDSDEHRFQKITDKVTSVVLRNFSPESKYAERFKEFNSHFMDRLVDDVRGESAEPYSVICHGDCWMNNLLFKYSEDGKTPESTCLLDLQLARYSSPITDIAYLLYCCTDGELRRQAYQSLMSEYYSTLCQFLTTLGSDPDKLFPRSAFEEHEKQFSQFGLGMAMLGLTVFTARFEDTPDLESDGAADIMSVLIEKSASNRHYMKRMKDIVVDMVDRNFI